MGNDCSACHAARAAAALPYLVDGSAVPPAVKDSIAVVAVLPVDDGNVPPGWR